MRFHRLKRMHVREVERPWYVGLSLWSLAYMAMVVLLLIACSVVYHARWNAYPRLWRVLEGVLEEAGEARRQEYIPVRVDAEHVIYVGEEQRIVPLDGVFKAVKALQSGQAVVRLHIATGVESGMLVSLLAQLEGFPVQLASGKPIVDREY